MLARDNRPRLAAAAIMLVLIVLLAMLGIVSASLLSGRRLHPALLIDLVPTALYLWAIWMARRAVLLVARGEALQRTLSRMLAQIGLALFAGGLAKVVVMPLILRVASGNGAYLHYDVSAITIGAVGVALLIVSRSVAEAEAIRAELDEIV